MVHYIEGKLDSTMYKSITRICPSISDNIDRDFDTELELLTRMTGPLIGPIAVGLC